MKTLSIFIDQGEISLGILRWREFGKNSQSKLEMHWIILGSMWRVKLGRGLNWMGSRFLVVWWLRYFVWNWDSCKVKWLKQRLGFEWVQCFFCERILPRFEREDVNHVWPITSKWVCVKLFIVILCGFDSKSVLTVHFTGFQTNFHSWLFIQVVG